MRGSFTNGSLWKTVCTLCSCVVEVGWKILLGLSCAFFGTGGLWAKAYSSVNWQLHLSPGNWGADSSGSLMGWRNVHEMFLYNLPCYTGVKGVFCIICFFVEFASHVSHISFSINKNMLKYTKKLCTFLSFSHVFHHHTKTSQRDRIHQLVFFSVSVKKATGLEITRQQDVATPVSHPSFMASVTSFGSHSVSSNTSLPGIIF